MAQRAKRTVVASARKRAATKTRKPAAAKTRTPVAAKTRKPATAKARTPVAAKSRKRATATPGNAPSAVQWIGEPSGTGSVDEASRPDVERYSGAARTGRHELLEHLSLHTETDPTLTGGDIDANWETAYSSGDEAAGGDNPTPGQDVVDDLGRALGVHYEDGEELRGADKVVDRDRHRWEWDPASADDYQERARRRRPDDV